MYPVKLVQPVKIVGTPPYSHRPPMFVAIEHLYPELLSLPDKLSPFQKILTCLHIAFY